jgi:MFS family permease
VFFVGVLPALFTLWIRRNVKEPDEWRAVRRQSPAGARDPARPTFTDLFRGPLGVATVAVTLMNACTLFGWWGLNTWVPAYLMLPPSEGGVGLSSLGGSTIVFITQGGMWLGYVSFGFISDALGRKRAYVLFVLVAGLLLPLYGLTRNATTLVMLGPLVAFFGSGYFSGFGPLTADLYPTAIRATAQGFTYNVGRVASAAAPFTVGSLAATHGFGLAFAVTGAAFLLAAVAWVWIPGRTCDYTSHSVLSARRSTFPIIVFGSSDRNSTSRGTL